MKFTSIDSKENLTKPDSSSSPMFLLGVVNLSPDFQIARADTSIDNEKTTYNGTCDRQISDSKTISSQKSVQKYDKADTNYVNFDEEDQMVTCLLICSLNIDFNKFNNY